MTCCTPESYGDAFCGHWRTVGPHFGTARHLTYNRPLDKYHSSVLVFKCWKVIDIKTFPHAIDTHIKVWSIHFRDLNVCELMWNIQNDNVKSRAWWEWGAALMRSNKILADQVLLTPGTSKIGEMRSNKMLADQVLPTPGTSKIGERRSNKMLADQVLPTPGTSKIGEMRSNKMLADQVLPTPGTSKIGERRSNKMLADQVLPTPGTSKIGEMRSNKMLADQVLPTPGT